MASSRNRSVTIQHPSTKDGEMFLQNIQFNNVSVVKQF